MKCAIHPPSVESESSISGEGVLHFLGIGKHKHSWPLPLFGSHHRPGLRGRTWMPEPGCP